MLAPRAHRTLLARFMSLGMRQGLRRPVYRPCRTADASWGEESDDMGPRVGLERLTRSISCFATPLQWLRAVAPDLPLPRAAGRDRGAGQPSHCNRWQTCQY